MDTHVQPPSDDEIWLYRPLVFKFCVSSVRNHTDPMSLAEDLTQEVMIKACLNSHSFRGQCSLSSWIYRIAFHHCVSFSRSGGKRALALISFGDLQSINPQTGCLPWESFSTNPEDELIRQMDARRSIQKLRDSMDDPVWLEILEMLNEGWSCKDMSRLLGCKLDTFKTRLHRIRKVLKARLKAAASL